MQFHHHAVAQPDGVCGKHVHLHFHARRIADFQQWVAGLHGTAAFVIAAQHHAGHRRRQFHGRRVAGGAAAQGKGCAGAFEFMAGGGLAEASAGDFAVRAPCRGARLLHELACDQGLLAQCFQSRQLRAGLFGRGLRGTEVFAGTAQAAAGGVGTRLGLGAGAGVQGGGGQGVEHDQHLVHFDRVADLKLLAAGLPGNRGRDEVAVDQARTAFGFDDVHDRAPAHADGVDRDRGRSQRKPAQGQYGEGGLSRRIRARVMVQSFVFSTAIRSSWSSRRRISRAEPAVAASTTRPAAPSPAGEIARGMR